jgi:hypothetical protein
VSPRAGNHRTKADHAFFAASRLDLPPTADDVIPMEDRAGLASVPNRDEGPLQSEVRTACRMFDVVGRQRVRFVEAATVAKLVSSAMCDLIDRNHGGRFEFCLRQP